MSARRQRFQRSQTASLQLTADDVAIVAQVAEHRFLSSRHLQRLLPHRSGKKLIERLGELYHAGYLDRPRAQLTYYATAGSAPLVYALGNAGARLLHQNGRVGSADLDWTWKNRSVGREFIAHTLMTSDLRVALACALRSHPHVQLNTSLPTSACFNAHIEGRVTAVIPDFIFGLETATTGRRKNFFLESDRATMPVIRSDLRRTSMQRKFMAYLAGGGRDNVFGQQLGIDNFRVLVVTTSAERIANMIDAVRDLTHGTGSRQFLFVEHAALRETADLFGVKWQSAKGDVVSLLE